MILASDPEGLVMSWQMSPERTMKCAAGEPGSHKYSAHIKSHGGNQISVTFFLKLEKLAEVKKTRKWRIASCKIVAGGLQFALTPVNKSVKVDILQIVAGATAEGAGNIAITFKSPAEVHERKPHRPARLRSEQAGLGLAEATFAS